MRITGVVKGTEQDAVVAANKHMLQIKVLHVLANSVTIEFLCTKPTQSNMLSYSGECIRDWFNNRQIPALPGTLLLYSYHSDGPLPSKQQSELAAHAEKLLEDAETYIRGYGIGSDSIKLANAHYIVRKLKGE